MVTLHRKHIRVKAERRNKSRIELHMPVVIFGVDNKAKIIDFSTNGFHIALSGKSNLKTGRQINLALRFPSEKNVIKLKARVVYKDPKGIGCQFIELTPQLAQILDRSFDIFNATLPI